MAGWTYALEPPQQAAAYLRLLLYAAVSRLAVLGLAIAANLLLPDHEAQGVERFVDGSLEQPTVFETFTRWDSAYFLSIARDGGYASHHLERHAFFPLYPTAIRLLAGFLQPTSHRPEAPDGRSLVIAGLIISNLSFVGACLALYSLSLATFKDRRLSWVSALVFIASPASIFFSTVYTESTYALFSFTGHWLWAIGWPLTAVVPFMLATATRSNGVTNCVPLVATLVWDLVTRAVEARRRQRRVSFFDAVWRCARVGMACVAIVSPYVLFQAYGWWCHCPASAPEDPPWDRPIWSSIFRVTPNDSHKDSDPYHDKKWCKSLLPNLYSHVQCVYWNVGPFKYWQLKQVPNFMLAAPVLILSALGAFRYFISEASRVAHGRHVSEKGLDGVYSTRRAAGLQLQWVVLSGFCLVVAHVQIATRLLASSCPPLYWFIALLLSDTSSTGRQTRTLLIAYLVIFNTVGPILHCNFFPWT